MPAYRLDNGNEHTYDQHQHYGVFDRSCGIVIFDETNNFQ